MKEPSVIEDKITKAQKLTIAVTVGVCLLTVALNILVREWYSPDLRYHVGDNYYLDDRVVTSCEVRNRGHQSAKTIRVYAAFDSPVLAYQVGGDVSSKVVAGHVGDKRIVLEIDRLVPKANFTVFYSIRENQTSAFIEKIDSEEGFAKTGDPKFWTVLTAIFVCTALWGLSSLVKYLNPNPLRSHQTRIEVLIGVIAGYIRRGVPKAEFIRQMRDLERKKRGTKGVMTLTESDIAIAEAVYDALEQDKD